MPKGTRRPFSVGLEAMSILRSRAATEDVSLDVQACIGRTGIRKETALVGKEPLESQRENRESDQKLKVRLVVFNHSFEFSCSGIKSQCPIMSQVHLLRASCAPSKAATLNCESW